MELPEIIKDRMDMEINEQLSITLFPEEGQPACDVVKLNFTEVEGRKISIYMTPCEAMEIASALNTAVQFFLYNQEQYREEILKVRLKAVEARSKEPITLLDAIMTPGKPESIELISKSIKDNEEIQAIEEKLDEEFDKTAKCYAAHEKLRQEGFKYCYNCGHNLQL
jgi:RNA polymerase-binding transcription factor DksA